MVKLSNKEIEDRTIQSVLCKLGKDAKDIRKHKRGYDIKYKDKIIEVKGTQSRFWKQNISFSTLQEYEVCKNNKNKYRLYKVYDIGKSPGAEEIKVIQGKNLEPPKDPRWKVKIKEDD